MVERPKIFFTVSGSSEGFTELNAFDNCLLKAGVGDTNLVKMSSIVPPRCRRSDPVPIPPGSLVPVAYAFVSSETPGQVISAAVSVALPEDEDLAGLIMEYSADSPLGNVTEIVKEMAKKGFESRRRGIKELFAAGAEHKVDRCGGAFAAVVLWY
jgi:arginine decarboxylase